MCGPSDALKGINSNIQDFAKQVKSEAGTIFDDASGVFGKIMDSVEGLLKGGPTAFGYSQNQYSAMTASTVNAGAAEARNLKGAAASSAAAIGGGNAALPAGATQSATFAADQKAAADTAATENANLQEGYKVGNENFFKAEQIAANAPNVFATANDANRNVSGAQKLAMTSQQNIDTQSNWAMNDVMKLGTAAVSAAVGGATGGAGGGGLFSSLGGMFKGKDDGGLAANAAAPGYDPLA